MTRSFLFEYKELTLRNVNLLILGKVGFRIGDYKVADYHTVMESGRCMECGAKEVDGFSCYELFGFPLSGNIVIQRYMLYILACFMLYQRSFQFYRGRLPIAG